MFKRVTRQNRVTLFNIHLHLVLKAKAFEEAVNCGNVIVILMFCWLLGFGFDQNRAFEPNLVFVLNHHG